MSFIYLNLTPLPMPTPELSIIIPTYKTKDLTLACIQYLQDNPILRPYEIVVIDNASMDGTVEAIHESFPSVQIWQNQGNYGFSRACNKGASLAKGKWFCFLNSDTLANGQALNTLLCWLETNPSTGIVGPLLLSETQEIIQMSWGWNPIHFWELLQQYFAPYAIQKSRLKTHWVRALHARQRDVEIICGACLVIRREAFEAIHGFDENFELYFEDSDLCIRCREAGWNVHFLPEARIVHHLGKSSVRRNWGLVPLIYRQSQIYYYRKHTHLVWVYLLKAYQWIKWSYILLKYIYLREDKSLIRHYLRCYKDIILESKHYTLDPIN